MSVAPAHHARDSDSTFSPTSQIVVPYDIMDLPHDVHTMYDIMPRPTISWIQ